MQPAHHAPLGRQRVVVLHERPGDAGLGEPPLCQVSEKNPRPSRKRCGVSSITSGMASRFDDSCLLPLGQFHQHPAKFGLAELLRVPAQLHRRR